MKITRILVDISMDLRSGRGYDLAPRDRRLLCGPEVEADAGCSLLDATRRQAFNRAVYNTHYLLSFHFLTCAYVVDSTCVAAMSISLYLYRIYLVHNTYKSKKDMSSSPRKPHIIALDEPTNYIDMETLDALVQGLSRYKGGIIAPRSPTRSLALNGFGGRVI